MGEKERIEKEKSDKTRDSLYFTFTSLRSTPPSSSTSCTNSSANKNHRTHIMVAQPRRHNHLTIRILRTTKVAMHTINTRGHNLRRDRLLHRRRLTRLVLHMLSLPSIRPSSYQFLTPTLHLQDTRTILCHLHMHHILPSSISISISSIMSNIQLDQHTRQHSINLAQ